MEYIVSTDNGGTFVDAAILDELGRLSIGKAPSTPDNPSTGIVAAVHAAAERIGLSSDHVLRRCRMFFNGTTVATNAMIQRTGARTGLLTTKGFEDTLIIGRVMARTAGLSEAELTNYQKADRPAPIVPVTLTRGVTERVDYKGDVLCPLSLDEVKARVEELVKLGIEALSVSLLWSFRNPTHEQRIRDFVKQEFPQLYVTISSDLVPVIREYERTNTTAINCYLGPILDRYLTDVQQAVKQKEYPGELLVMQSIGGLAPAGEIRQFPITTLYSGPVGGIVAAQRLGELLDESNIITTDMGGTSFDVGMIVDGLPQASPTTVMQRNVVIFPAVDVVTIGAGGGSVAWLDNALALHVGPQSQGARPGPACYGAGGDLPTVTDADVVLGYINPDYFLAGTLKLHREKSIEAIRGKIADPLGISIEEAAHGIYEIVNAHMADLVRKVSVERGYDPRHFCMFAFGGCGPTHCTGYGPDIGVTRMIIPSAATVFSALGIAESDIKHFYSKTSLVLVPQNLDVAPEKVRQINAIFDELLARAAEQLERDGIAREKMVLSRGVDVRYKDQVHELMVPVVAEGHLDIAALGRLCADFMKRHEMLYGPGSSSSQVTIELVNLRVTAVASTGFRHVPERHPLADSNASSACVGFRPVYWHSEKGYVTTPAYRGEQLSPGNRVAGPAVIELYGTTIPLHPGQSLMVDQYLNFLVEL